MNAIAFFIDLSPLKINFRPRSASGNVYNFIVLYSRGFVKHFRGDPVRIAPSAACIRFAFGTEKEIPFHLTSSA